MSDQNPASPGQESFGSVPAGRESFGSVPSGEQSFGATPAPPAPGSGTPAVPAVAAAMPGSPEGAPPPPVAIPEKKKGGALRWILIGLVVLVLAVAGGVWKIRNAVTAPTIAVGDCIDATQFSTSLSDVKGKKTIDCADSKASHKVIGIVADKPSSELNNDAVCTAYPKTVATIWLGSDAKSGSIYCLAELPK